ncbi:unnamed protein product [Microthlaspi erraticum]|uniref:SIAH-type domain-containing protein n=1 Tax=Microthlaspi erraticum TaxID=1685480 RepID=A0A6D2IT70_9BRAS|nr:unnamed protein product [Microthlaspi erraticum]
MEKIIEASIVPCRNSVHRCKETTTYGYQSSSHEKLCAYIPCSCPLPNCNYIGSYTDLKSHARSSHSRDEDYLIPFALNQSLIFGIDLKKKENVTVFQEEKDGDLIVVQGFKRSHGAYVTVSCISPLTPGLRNFSCSLAKLKEHATLRLGFMVKKIQKVGVLQEGEEPKDGFMLIPSYMLTTDHLKMQICIGSEYKYIHI